MDNASYALYIAVGVLIAIAVLSLVLFGYRRLAVLEQSQDEVIVVKNRADFNKEYEAYEKTLMYGSDVLSCLNKAQNNNQKYVYNNYYGTDTTTMGREDREEYFIDVVVKINSPLYDSVKAYYKDPNGKYQQVFSIGNASNYADTVFTYNGTKYTFKDPSIYYYYFEKGKVYQKVSTYRNVMWANPSAVTSLASALRATSNSGQILTKFQGGHDYHLLANDYNSTSLDMDDAAMLSALTTAVGLKAQRVENKDTPSELNNNDWWYCTWTTAVSDFKSRKFRCTGTKYNNETGYINEISFEEVSR